MRLSSVLILAGIMQVSAAVYSQNTRITLSMENKTIKEVLDQIEQVSDVRFFYNSSYPVLNKQVTVEASSRPIEDVLKGMLASADVSYKVMEDNLILIAPKALIQQQIVTGQVRDAETGDPMPGVNITVQGTTVGTISDLQGSYTLTIPSPDAVLQFSFIGYLTENVPAGGRVRIDVDLKPEVSVLREVVVTGYSVERKKDIIGSVAVVNTSDMVSTPTSNVGVQLQGRVAGITIGSDGAMGGLAKVRIRGFGSFGASEPLYIIDGVPGSIDALNPNDIESIQVLKDAASSSIYGARAANGVLIVTTKKGKANTLNVNLDSYYGLNYVSKSSFPDLLDARQYGEWYWQSMRGAGINPGESSWRHHQYGTGLNPVIPEYIWAGGKPGTDLEELRVSNPAEFAELTDPANYDFATHQIVKAGNTDWFKEVYKTAPIQNHQLTISGGSKDAVFLLGLNYFDQESTADRYSFFKRYSVRANSSFKIGKYLEIGENLQVSDEKFRNVSNQADVWTSPALLPIYDIMGNPTGSIVPGMINTSQGRNPVTEPWRNRFDHNGRSSFFGNAYVQLNPVKNLFFKSNFGYNYSMLERRDLSQATYEYSTNTTINSLLWNWTKKDAWVWTNTMNYSIDIQNNAFKVLLGTEAIDDLTRFISATRNNFSIQDSEPFLVLNAGTGAQINSGSYVQSKLFSVFGRLDYSYADQFYVNATLRRDGSSKFGKDSRFGYFPAFAAGWRISSLSFMKSLSWLDDLKLRASYGIIGNQSGLAPENQYSSFVSDLREAYPLAGGNNLYLSSVTSRLGNPIAKWEKAVTTNVGFDASILSGKLMLNVDYFIKDTENLLVVNQPPYTGPNVTQPSINVGNIRNKGIEINLVNRGQIAGAVDYEVTANLGSYKNEARKVLDNDDATINGVSNRLGVVTLTQTGYPISFFYGYILDGFFNTQQEVDEYLARNTTTWIPPKVGRWKIKDVSGPDGVPDGQINAYDRTYLGDPHPDFQLGLNIALMYKNFDFTTFVFWNQGGHVFNYNRYNVDFNTYMYQRSARMLNDTWRPDHQNALLPALDINDSYSNLYATNYYVESATYVRMRNVQLGYTFSENILSRIGAKKIRVYLQAQNLFTITNKNFSGLDPGVSIKGDDLGMGVISTETPTPKQVLFGLNVTF